MMSKTVTNNKIKLEIEIDAEEWEWFLENYVQIKEKNEEEKLVHALRLIEKAAHKIIYERKIYLAQQQIYELH
jgi:hypothetical protein